MANMCSSSSLFLCVVSCVVCVQLAFTQANTELLELRRKQYLQHLGAGDATTDAFYAINI